MYTSWDIGHVISTSGYWLSSSMPHSSWGLTKPPQFNHAVRPLKHEYTIARNTVVILTILHTSFVFSSGFMPLLWFPIILFIGRTEFSQFSHVAHLPNSGNMCITVEISLLTSAQLSYVYLPLVSRHFGIWFPVEFDSITDTIDEFGVLHWKYMGFR